MILMWTAGLFLVHWTYKMNNGLKDQKQRGRERKEEWNGERKDSRGDVRMKGRRATQMEWGRLSSKSQY